jgi:hypothetical protein
MVAPILRPAANSVSHQYAMAYDSFLMLIASDDLVEVRLSDQVTFFFFPFIV